MLACAFDKPFSRLEAIFNREYFIMRLPWCCQLLPETFGGSNMALKSIKEVMKTVSRPEKVLQFGEGGFLRA
ncbi:MAG: hypothetical protein IJP90_12840, partial [Treponema sp.]|nr:hypothetical protein [Treponema sp.]